MSDGQYVLDLFGDVLPERHDAYHPFLEGLAASPIIGGINGSGFRRCNDCGGEIAPGQRPVFYASAMGDLPFCAGCAGWRRITLRAVPSAALSRRLTR